MLKVWLSWIRSYWLHRHYESILPTLVSVKPSHSLKKEDFGELVWPLNVTQIVQCTSPGSMLVGEAGFGSVSKDTSTFSGYPLPGEKKKGLYSISLPYTRHHLQGEKACNASGQGDPGSSMLDKGSLTFIQRIWSKARWMSPSSHLEATQRW